MSKPAAVVLARYESESRPGHFHEVRRGADGNVYCLCPSWRFQHNSPSNRTCKHIENWKAHTLVPGANGASLLDVLGPGPEAIRPVRRSRKVKNPVVVAPTVRAESPKHDTIPAPPPAFESEPGVCLDEPEWGNPALAAVTEALSRSA